VTSFIKHQLIQKPTNIKQDKSHYFYEMLSSSSAAAAASAAAANSMEQNPS
jgi:hypothetical protein